MKKRARERNNFPPPRNQSLATSLRIHEKLLTEATEAAFDFRRAARCRGGGRKAMSRAGERKLFSVSWMHAIERVARALNVALHKRKANTRAETRGLLISTLAAHVTSARHQPVACRPAVSPWFFVFSVLSNEIQDDTRGTCVFSRHPNHALEFPTNDQKAHLEIRLETRSEFLQLFRN